MHNSDDVPPNPSNNQDQTVRGGTPAQKQVVAQSPSDLQADADGIMPQAPGGAAPHPNAAGDGRGGVKPDIIVIKDNKGTMVETTALVANLPQNPFVQLGISNSMTFHSSGATTTDSKIPPKIPQSIQKIPDDQLLRDISQERSLDWRKLGKRLKLDDVTLDQVNADHTTLPEVIYQMLRKWKMRYPATLQTLVQALADIGRQDLADRVINMV